MRYLHTMLRVRDLDVALSFWRDQLGMIETNRIENSGGRFTLAFLAAPEDEETGRTSKAPLLELTYNWPEDGAETAPYAEGRAFGHLAFVVDDIYAVCARLEKAGVTLNRPPRDGHMAFVRSPDGQSVELLQKGKAQPQQDPWRSMPNSGEW